MDSIIIKINCHPKYRLLSELRAQGLLFDTVRNALDVDYEGLKEITDAEYELLEKLKK
jgi:hypothetical protein